MFCHMKRTTIRLNDRLSSEVKQLAARSGRTFTAVVEDALRETVARERQPTKRKRIVLPTSKGGWVRPGINIDDSAALLDLMEANADS